MAKNNQGYKVIHAVIVAILTALFSLLFLVIWRTLSEIIWPAGTEVANRWLIPLIVITASLIVGLAQKYLGAVDMLSGSFFGEVEEGRINYRNFPGMFLSALVSLLSGASVGPEGGIGHLAGALSAWYAQKMKIPTKHIPSTLLSGISSAYNGLIGNPLFAAIFTSEVSAQKKGRDLSALAFNLIAGAIGFLIFNSIGVKPFANIFQLEPLDKITLPYLFYAFSLGLVGIFVGILTGLFFMIAKKFFLPLQNKVILKALMGGLVIAAVGYFFPLTMFSGEHELGTIFAEPAKLGVILLIGLAVIKLFLLAISLSSGFVGGPMFPVIFSSVLLGLAFNALFPSIPVAMAAACILVSSMFTVLKAPLTAVFLSAIIFGANTNLTTLIIFALATAMIIEPKLKGKITT